MRDPWPSVDSLYRDALRDEYGSQLALRDSIVGIDWCVAPMSREPSPWWRNHVETIPGRIIQRHDADRKRLAWIGTARARDRLERYGRRIERLAREDRIG